jgi:hypothetical protein
MMHDPELPMRQLQKRAMCATPGMRTCAGVPAIDYDFYCAGQLHKVTEPPGGVLAALTRCTMMQDPELPIRPLQNHLPLEMHLTTHAGLCTPQYLWAGSRT